ncbi:MAG: hypothetical protein JRJ43_11585 [Deltaproteobacteria bacterium]|nr:hypothetical protein [Deltaproteobacteria bacterium]MBW1720176.1 hypothetical protein [Deltaproteobacteria bacterium]MBW1938771.1 hypothetical protein [Deltaproteobacteria bacterium]MBW1965110.1 hypothetical protein [Deltaproteobacteria bacterium]MBW2081151.1 hypothetical protein [Deltaproteobacteria bacterium]
MTTPYPALCPSSIQLSTIEITCRKGTGLVTGAETPTVQYEKPSPLSVIVNWLVCARHGRELMG